MLHLLLQLAPLLGGRLQAGEDLGQTGEGALGGLQHELANVLQDPVSNQEVMLHNCPNGPGKQELAEVQPEDSQGSSVASVLAPLVQPRRHLSWKESI